MSVTSLYGNVTSSTTTSPVGVPTKNMYLLVDRTDGNGVAAYEGTIDGNAWFPITGSPIYSGDGVNVYRITDLLINGIRTTITISAGRMDATVSYI